MIVDPLRLAIAVVPVAAYVLVLGLLNLRRRPFLTSGGCDLTALGIALSGLMFVGPMELLRPESATRSFGNYVWLFLLLFYWLWLLLGGAPLAPTARGLQHQRRRIACGTRRGRGAD